MRVGIGRPDNRHDVTAYVLSKFGPSEVPVIKDTVEQCCKALMNELHSLISQNNASWEEHSGMATDEFQVQHLL